MPELTPEQIRSIRAALGLTQLQLAGRLGYGDKQPISDAECGRRMLNPTARMLLGQWREELTAAGKLPRS